jgi:hypothetical protein
MNTQEMRKKLVKLYLEYYRQSIKFDENGSIINYFRSQKNLKKMALIIAELKRELRRQYKKTDDYQKKYGENGTRVEIVKNLPLKYGRPKNGKT